MKTLKEFEGFSESINLNKIKGGDCHIAPYTVVTTNCGGIEDTEKDED